jgi:hypothetical protein
MKLKRSNDRKVTNASTPNGKSPAIANTFGLPSGKNYSCPNATSVCEKVCYAGKLEKIYKGVKDTLLHNWELLQGKSVEEMVALIDEMITAFHHDCQKRGAEQLFRIHWDGDFFSPEYTKAWALVIDKWQDIQFWVYTRVPSAITILAGLPNLSLYFSTDSENKPLADALLTEHPNQFKIAYLADTFQQGKEILQSTTGKVGAACPEQRKQIPLISTEGGACVMCRLCVDGKSDIRFSISKR